MRSAILALALMSCGPAAPPTQAAKPDRKFTMDDRTRFLAAAIFEGLHEDGPAAGVFDAILKDRDRHFVPKCLICNPVAGAIEGYVAYSKACLIPCQGNGFPAEIERGLKSADRAARLKAIEAMVDRYVTQYFERSTMTPGEKGSMKNWILMGRKYAMGLREESFGDYCPSCNGAANN